SPVANAKSRATKSPSTGGGYSAAGTAPANVRSRTVLMQRTAVAGFIAQTSLGVRYYPRGRSAAVSAMLSHQLPYCLPARSETIPTRLRVDSEFTPSRLRPRPHSALLAAALGILITTLAGHAQSRRPMTLVDIAQVPRILDVQLAPDGRSVLYMLNRADWKANRQLPHLWKQDIGAAAPVQMTFGDAGEGGGRWSPDGKTILFSRGGQIYLLPTDGGEPRQLTRHGTTVASPAWSPDS